jgi:hypothetical protein
MNTPPKDLKYVCWVVSRRNKLAKERMVYRNRRRNYDRKNKQYKTSNEAQFKRMKLLLRHLSKETTRELRRALKSMCGKLVNDKNAGYDRIYLHGQRGNNDYPTRILYRYHIEELAIQYEADLAIHNLLTEQISA